jgi:multidrug efflux pump subunit AcrB
VTAPLERNFGQIPLLQQMTSSSSYGISLITLQLELNRDIDVTAQDVQAAINSFRIDAPAQPTPGLLQGEPADAPMVTLAITYDLISVNGTFYHYCEIDAGTVSSLLSAPSIERFYNARIKGQFDCRVHRGPEY